MNLICLVKGHEWHTWDGDEHSHSHSCENCGKCNYAAGSGCWYKSTAICIEIDKKMVFRAANQLFNYVR